MNIQLVMAARWRVLSGQNMTLSGAIMAKRDDEVAPSIIEEAYENRGSSQPWSPLDILELMIAERVDGGEVLPVTNPEAYGAARWLASGVDPANPDKWANLPSPIPRSFVLYFAAAWHERGWFPTVTDALKDILTNKTFSAT